MKRTITPLALAVCTLSPGYALNPGDIAIIGFNFDTPDSLAFVALTDIDAGTEISFTDNGWQSDDTFRNGEGTFTYAADNAISAGSIIAPEVSGLSLSAAGDQILAYQGLASAPTFIYGLNSEGTGWQAGATDSNTSAAPAGLTDGLTAVAFAEVDNGIFDTSALASGTQSQWLQAIANPNNWTFRNTASYPLPSGSIAVTAAIPEPSTYATVLGAVALGTIMIRRKYLGK